MVATLSQQRVGGVAVVVVTGGSFQTHPLISAVPWQPGQRTTFLLLYYPQVTQRAVYAILKLGKDQQSGPFPAIWCCPRYYGCLKSQPMVGPFQIPPSQKSYLISNQTQIRQPIVICLSGEEVREGGESRGGGGVPSILAQEWIFFAQDI
jgi:hypothetical protein